MTLHDPLHDPTPKTELPALHESWLPRDHPLHRPRHGGQQLVALVAAVVFFASPLVSWASGARAAAFENRKLAEFPSISQGWGFFTGLGRWATDNLVFRQAAVQAESGISRGVFGEELPLDHGQSGGPLQPGSTQQDDRPVNGNPPTQSGYPPAFDGKDGWLYLGSDVAQKCKPSEPFTDTITQLKRLQQAVEASGRKFVLLVPPDKTTEVPEHLPEHYVGQECHDAATADLWQQLQSVGGVVDPRADMRSYGTVSGRPIYHQLDSHWTDEGALVGVKDLADNIQPGVSASWSEYPDQTFSSQGDLPPLLGRTGTIAGRGYQLRPDGKTDKTQMVNPIFSNPIRVSSTPVSGMITSKVGILGDSYSIPASRYYAAAFADLTMVTYATADAHPDVVANFVADRKVVVLEMVERNIAGGFSNILRPGCVDAITRVLAAHPMH